MISDHRTRPSRGASLNEKSIREGKTTEMEASPYFRGRYAQKTTPRSLIHGAWRRRKDVFETNCLGVYGNFAGFTLDSSINYFGCLLNYTPKITYLDISDAQIIESGLIRPAKRCYRSEAGAALRNRASF